MDTDCILFKKTGYFSDLVCDYLDENDSLKPFYNRFPHIDNFKAQIKEKGSDFSQVNREVLHRALEKQYKNTEQSKNTKVNIAQLKEGNTFTVVTGHQLNLFTGPLYFLYKIITTINLSKELKKKYPKYHFVPIYWMATEDHDFDEINFFNLKGKKVQWNRKASGAVGRMETKGLEAIFKAFSSQIGNSDHANDLKELFSQAYLHHENLTDATRFLANALFGEYGLVIVDGDDRELKSLMVPYIERELLQNTSFKEVAATVSELEKLPQHYGIQVNPREINYFYLVDGVRERILEREGRFLVNETKMQFSKEELMALVKDHPERFSPNVITRPLYQEVILPNLCYIGGGGELAYWLELKTSFEAMQVPFPILLLRNSALVITEKQIVKLNKMNIKVLDLFMKQNSFINKKIREISNLDIDFSPQRAHLKKQFEELYGLAEKTDKSFLGAVKAQEVKQLKGLNKLEKRLLKAQKRKLKDHVVRMIEIQNELFPNKSLQERTLNFSELYLEYGDRFIPNLMEGLQPLSGDFSILKM